MLPEEQIALAVSVPAGAADGILAFPASIAQQMFWYLELLQGEVAAFNVPLRFRLTGPIDVDLLLQSLNTIIERHEALRSYLVEENGELLQIVMPELILSMPVIDISHFPAEQIQHEADRLATLEAGQTFQLSAGPIIRAELLRLAADSHILHVTVHHAMFDGMSMTVLTTELAKIYQAYFDGKRCPLEPLTLQFGDYSVWQKEFLEGPEVQKQLAYWKNQLAGMHELDLPTDFPRPAVKSWKGEITSILLPKELTDKLQALAARHGSTLFHLQLAAFMILLHRYTGSDDIALGAPVTGRTRGELESVIGVFINSLILRCNLSGNPGFEKLLRHVRETVLAAMENQELPFERLVQELRPERDPSRNPLFQINFNHHRSFTQASHFGGVTLAPIPSRSPGAIFDLHFFLVERQEGWRASCDYSTELFTHQTANRMLGHYQSLLEDIVKNPEKPIDELEILTPSERQQLLHEWSGNQTDFPRDSTIGQLFIATAEKFPNRIALTHGEKNYSYLQLHAEASHLANHLLANGLQHGDLIAICTRAVPEMIVGFIAILLAGGCCVPLDPSDPTDRVVQLLEKCSPRIAITTAGCSSVFPANWQGKVIEIPPFGGATDPLAVFSNTPKSTDPAYLLFTSGSTGKPKGVLLGHRGIVRLVKNNGFLTITPQDVFLQAAPVSFDASLWEIWGPLLNGGRLVLMPSQSSLDQIAQTLISQHVTILWLTAGLFQLMIDEQLESLCGIKFLLAGGDILSPAHVRRAMNALPDTQLINGYGPTENTTFTACHAISRNDLNQPSIPIGKPIANSTIYLLDSNLRPVPIGIPGELFTGGDGLAIGYHAAPELTAEKFIDHPKFGRLYRSGDLCKWRIDGTIEFIGRRDHQVKVRGFRIELGEIEANLLDHPAVIQAKVTVRGSSAETKRILAWAIARTDSGLTRYDLTKFLADRLPAFMRPDGISLVDSFPLNANGKIDLTALLDSNIDNENPTSRTREAPTGEVEVRLAQIWSELLGVAVVYRDDDFFALGGHSLVALRIFSRISRDFGKSLPLNSLLQNPTIRLLAQSFQAMPANALVQTEQILAKGNLVTLHATGSEPPLFCIHGGDGGILFYRNLAALMPKTQPFYAIESLELGQSTALATSSIEETAAAYVNHILARFPAGPYRLAGYSFGGVVAYEMACLLTEQGHRIDFLGLFDTHNPHAISRNYSATERVRVFMQQNQEQAPIQRLKLLKNRIVQGLQTHHQVRAGQKAAQLSGPAEAYSDLRRIQVREENWRAMQLYQPRSFAGHMTLFKATQVNDKLERPADYGWSCIAEQGLDIVPAEGEHLTLFADANVRSLAEALNEAIQHTAKRNRISH